MSFAAVRIVETPLPGPVRVEQVAEALGDAYARKVLASCVKAGKAVKEIAAETGLPLPTAYRHVNELVAKGLLVVERSGMTPDGKRFEVYRSRLRYARLEVDGGGERVVWEPNEPIEEKLARMWLSLRGRRE